MAYDRNKNRIKLRARAAAGKAVRRGWLKKENCAICDSNKNLQAHHVDYEERFNVVWLCAKHHKWVDSDAFGIFRKRELGV